MVIKLKGKTVKYRTEEHPPTATIKGEQQRQNSKKTHSAFVVSCPKFRGFNLGEGGKSKRIRKARVYCSSWISMDRQGHGGQPTSMGLVGSGAQVPYGTNPYQQNQMAGGPNPGPAVTSVGAIQSTSQPGGAQLAQHQLAYQQIHHQQQQQLQQQLQSFWANQYQEIEKVNDFKNHSLPLARIKKIMKADEDVRMISAEAPVIFARACEMFILELTLRSWNHTEENKRRTLQKNDIAAAITRTDIFDFLVDIVPREDLKDEVLASIPRGTLPVGGPPDMPPYCYMPTQHASQVGSAGLIMGKPVMDPAIYAQQPHPYMGQQMWPQGADQQQSPSDH